jgi:hypothetical protein
MLGVLVLVILLLGSGVWYRMRWAGRSRAAELAGQEAADG